MKIQLLIFLTLTFLSCKNTKETEAVSIQKNVQDTAKEKTVAPIVDKQLKSKKGKIIEILIPRSYRTFNDKNETSFINKNWVELIKQNGEYFIKKADYTIENAYDECSGDSTKILDSNNDALIFINLPQLKLGKVQNLKITKNKIWPKEKLTFRFNKVAYTLRAEGEIVSTANVLTDDGPEKFHDVKNYKLYISSTNKPEQLFLTEPSFNDTFVELLFVGDIDSDGILDFVIGANRDYEEERVLLFLSSEAKDNEIIRKVGEIAVQFDC